MQITTFRSLRATETQGQDRLHRVIDPAVRWLKRELDAQRRDCLDAQFMATAKGSRYTPENDRQD